MSETVWAIRVTLTTSKRLLLAGAGNVDEMAARIVALQNGAGDFFGNWCETQDSTMIAKAHIVEAALVPLSEGPVFAHG